MCVLHQLAPETQSSRLRLGCHWLCQCSQSLRNLPSRALAHYWKPFQADANFFPIAVATSMPALATTGMRQAHTLADRQAHRKNRHVTRSPGRIESENETAVAVGWGVGLVPARFAPERRHIARAWANT